MKTVIYHSADFDGIFCREIAKKFLGEKDVEYIGWNFGDAKINPRNSDVVFILDLSPECLDEAVQINDRIIWIDHHKSSMEKYPTSLPGYRIDGVAACRLAWAWFCENQISNRTGEAMQLPDKKIFVERGVTEPLAVRLAGEYDIWDHRGDGDLELQFGLRTLILDETAWDILLSNNSELITRELINKGRAAMEYSKQTDASVIKSRGYITEWEGLKFITLNSARFNSLTFDAMDVPETGHDALLGFCWNGKVWTVSLYHAKHRKDIDLSQIAIKYGGGGHRGACGFTCKKLPFLNEN